VVFTSEARGHREMSIDHPYIDFDGDGHGDSYQTIVHGGEHEYEHLDRHGHIDAIAYDMNHDGRIDSMQVDDDHDGHLDRMLFDENGDGIMDRSEHMSHGSLTVHHPYIDFNGDGHGDTYVTTTDGKEQIYSHLDGHGHIDRQAIDTDNDGRINEMYVADHGDGRIDRVLVDVNGDGIMDKSYRAY